MLNILEILFQLVLSIVLGGIIGIDRELKRKPGGLRTHILICLGSTFLMILSRYVAGSDGDPGRIAAQTIAGIGFIGGGVIMKYGFNVKGITTASTIWVVTAIGLGIGLSIYLGSILLTFLTWIILFYINKFEHKYFVSDESKILTIDLKHIKVDIEEIKQIFNKYNIYYKTLEMEKLFSKHKTHFRFLIYTPRNLDQEILIKELTNIPRIQKVSIEDQI